MIVDAFFYLLIGGEKFITKKSSIWIPLCDPDQHIIEFLCETLVKTQNREREKQCGQRLSL
jgi:hypothetical protein